MKPVWLRLVLFTITMGSVWLFTDPSWWFPAPSAAGGRRLDQQFEINFLVVGILFVAGQLVLVWVIGRFRRGNSSSNRHGSWVLEMAWTASIIVMFFWLQISGSRVWSEMVHTGHRADAVQVEVTGAQFQWYFRYPGRDGMFGRLDPAKFSRPDEGNPLGLDPADAAGKDDVVTSALVLPAGRDAELTLRAQDVIHSVFIPTMRFKQDAVPGMEIHAHITPTQTGTYELACSQLCGLGHYRMRALVRIVSPKEFDEWLESETKIATNRNDGQ